MPAPLHAPTDPTFTRHEDGTITAQFPDPPRPCYDVSHEMLEQWVVDMNELNRLRKLRDSLREFLGVE